MDDATVKAFIDGKIEECQKAIGRCKKRIEYLKTLTFSKAILLMPLSEFNDFPARALNALSLNFHKEKTAFTLYDLTQITERQLLKCRNLGKATVKEVKRFLLKYRLQLKPKDIL